MTSDTVVQTIGTLTVYLAQAKGLHELLDLLKQINLPIDRITIEQQSDDLTWYWLARIYVQSA